MIAETYCFVIMPSQTADPNAANRPHVLGHLQMNRNVVLVLPNNITLISEENKYQIEIAAMVSRFSQQFERNNFPKILYKKIIH